MSATLASMSFEYCSYHVTWDTALPHPLLEDFLHKWSHIYNLILLGLIKVNINLSLINSNSYYTYSVFILLWFIVLHYIYHLLTIYVLVYFLLPTTEILTQWQEELFPFCLLFYLHCVPILGTQWILFEWIKFRDVSDHWFFLVKRVTFRCIFY